MTEPTKEQIQWLWGQCGIEQRFESDTGTWYCHYPNGQCDIEYPPIDLNNLFEYAVPIVRQKLNEDEQIKYPFHQFMQKFAYAVAINQQIPNLALFRAIYEALRLDKDSEAELKRSKNGN